MNHPAEVFVPHVGDLFAGALIPGLFLCGLYLLWIVYKAILQPETVPALKMTDAERRGLPRRVLLALIPPLALIVAVLGSILGGIATPTESASIGAIGALLLAAMNQRLSFDTLTYASRNTMITTSIIFVIVLAASLFSLVFRGLGGEHLVETALKSVPGGAFGAMFAVMLIMFILGFFLDTFEIILIVLPICGPALIMLGLDPLWIGVMIGVNLQTSFLTPPFGFTLFYMRGIAPSSVTTGQIWMGAIPFVTLQVFALCILWAFPPLATWLPGEIFRQEQQAAGPAKAGGINSLIDDSIPDEEGTDDAPGPYSTPKQ